MNLRPSTIAPWVGALCMSLALPAAPAVFNPTGGEMHLSAGGETVERTRFSGTTDLTISRISLLHGGSVTGHVSPVEGIGADLTVAVQSSRVDATAAESIEFSGRAYGFSGSSTANGAGGAGQLGFDVATPTQAEFSFNWFNTPGAAVIMDANAYVYLRPNSSVGAPLVVCSSTPGANQNCWDELTTLRGNATGMFSLAQGHYVLDFATYTGARGGSTIPSGFNFSLVAVPIASNVWLMCCILGSLPLLLRNKVIRIVA